ncbi:hypothetical protein RF11_08879 [Thelohanellus kitauei]|uniref:Uncharacterized protein n=1 Tax=Thelohanellus kitauei TaxID=669202 RepID=A0A0C2N5K8_THEKT|nr:hypothetical protein RF11_08879 [Thelohanellus kitauei]
MGQYSIDDALHVLDDYKNDDIPISVSIRKKVKLLLSSYFLNPILIISDKVKKFFGTTFGEKIKRGLPLYGCCYDLDDSQDENVESQSTKEATLGSASDNESTNIDDSFGEFRTDDCFEGLQKYLTEQETVNTKILFDDVQDYRNIFSNLIKEEAEYDQKTARAQEKYKIPASCTVISVQKREWSVRNVEWC